MVKDAVISGVALRTAPLIFKPDSATSNESQTHLQFFGGFTLFSAIAQTDCDFQTLETNLSVM